MCLILILIMCIVLSIVLYVYVSCYEHCNNVLCNKSWSWSSCRCFSHPGKFVRRFAGSDNSLFMCLHARTHLRSYFSAQLSRLAFDPGVKVCFWPMKDVVRENASI